MGIAFVVLSSDSGEAFRKGYGAGQDARPYVMAALAVLVVVAAVFCAVWLARRR